jgi:hypothetical protein
VPYTNNYKKAERKNKIKTGSVYNKVSKKIRRITTGNVSNNDLIDNNIANNNRISKAKTQPAVTVRSAKVLYTNAESRYYGEVG